MWMFVGTIAGLTFGVAEQAFYTSNDIVAINQAVSANEAVAAVLSFAERVFVDGFQHAVWTGIAGFFIGMALNYRPRRRQLIILGIAVPALLTHLTTGPPADWTGSGASSSSKPRRCCSSSATRCRPNPSSSRSARTPSSAATFTPRTDPLKGTVSA
jgi:hypothetical protein